VFKLLGLFELGILNST